MSGLIGEKECSKCKVIKPLSQYYKHKHTVDGRRSLCKPCFPRTGGKPTPEQRAAGRRRRGETAATYIPKAVRIELSAKRKAVVLHDAHVALYRKAGRQDLRALLHDAHVRVFRSSAVQFRIRYNDDPEFAIRQRIRTQLRKKAKLHPKLDDLMRDAICRGGCSSKVQAVCGYSIADLVRHLELQFVDGMNWAAFMDGRIHIDHIIPQAAFDLSDADATRRCWALENLQPLWAFDNIRKGARMPMDLHRVPPRGLLHTGNASPDVRLGTNF